jgi:hypothetical protein
MKCSIGIVTREECHKTTYGAVNKELTLFSELSEEKQSVLKFRLGECDISSICKYHILLNRITCLEILVATR